MRERALLARLSHLSSASFLSYLLQLLLLPFPFRFGSRAAGSGSPVLCSLICTG
ncbi:hypothetical protein K523DRAFT_324208 [Schizophyllum commune Tattone D]|nr:hypothetical protein K523DRAFT_324208 [Schizophyllum commune Tattone D]